MKIEQIEQLLQIFLDFFISEDINEVAEDQL